MSTNAQPLEYIKKQTSGGIMTTAKLIYNQIIQPKTGDISAQ